jgi:O-antigen/teichoic acid export membrane protein
VATAFAALGVQFASLGVHTSSAWFVARDRGLLGTLLVNGVLVGSIAGGGLALLAGLAAVAFPSLAPLPAGLVLLSLLAIPVGLANLVILNLTLGLQRVRDFNAMELGQRVLAAAAILILVLAGAAMSTTAFGGVLLATVIVTAAGLWSLTRSSAVTTRPGLGLLRATAAYGFRSYLAGLFMFLVLRVDVIIVQRLLGDLSAGQYAVAVSLAEFAFLVPSTIATLLFPRLFSMANPRARWETAARWCIVVGVGATVAIPIGWYVSEPAITILYGTDFTPGAAALVLLLPGIAFLSVQTIVAHYQFAVGAPPIVVASPLLGAVLNVGLILALVPQFGLTGAAIASTLAYGAVLAASGIHFVLRRPGSADSVMA